MQVEKNAALRTRVPTNRVRLCGSPPGMPLGGPGQCGARNQTGKTHRLYHRSRFSQSPQPAQHPRFTRDGCWLFSFDALLVQC